MWIRRVLGESQILDDRHMGDVAYYPVYSYIEKCDQRIEFTVKQILIYYKKELKMIDLWSLPWEFLEYGTGKVR